MVRMLIGAAFWYACIVITFVLVHALLDNHND
jgi:hypothetical protein